MWSLRARICLGAAAVLTLISCHTASKQEVATAESQQVISESLKELYIACSAAPPQSSAQQNLVLRMAEQASSGKELLLVMRAGIGVFPSGQLSKPHSQTAESRVRSIVVSKMRRAATLGQMIEYARLYSINPEDAPRFAERMLQLADESRDPRIWRGIKTAAYHLKISDLERMAQAKGDQLSAK